MNREPIGLYIFRFVMGLGLFAFMCLLYWSSVLIEEDMKQLQQEMGELKRTMQMQRLDFERSVHKMREMPKRAAATPENKARYPNLLEKDPFYEETLPKILGEGFVPHGAFHKATIGKPHTLHPFSNWRDINNWIARCSGSAAQLQFGKYESYAPDLAYRIEERPSEKDGVPEFWVFLRSDVYWAPLENRFFSEDLELAPHFFERHQVTAEDFKFYFDAIMNPFNQEPGAISSKTYLQDIEEVRVVDRLTFVVRWRAREGPDGRPRIKYIARQQTAGLTPLASFVYKYFPNGKKIVEDDSGPETYRTSSLWAQNFAQHWAKNIIPSCGGWLFDGMSDREIRFRRNPQFYNPLAALAERMTVTFKSSPDTIWQDFKSNRLDSYELQPDQQIELDDFLNSSQYRRQADEEEGINRLDYLMRAYTFIGWNQKSPFFSSRKVRQAMTLAIDRERIISQNLNGMGVQTTGTFFKGSPSYNDSIEPWPFNPARARRLLEEEGWYDSDGDGILDKEIDGERVPFAFSLTYYVKNPLSKAIVEYVATALKEIGVRCHPDGVDLADLSAKFDDKSFDALYLAWALGTPPEEPRQLWHSDGVGQAGSSNMTGFANQEADAIIEKLEYTYNSEERLKLYHRFGAILHEEQPYTFLYTPKTALLYREYLKNVFIPAHRQDLVPGATEVEPLPSAFYLRRDD